MAVPTPMAPPRAVERLEAFANTFDRYNDDDALAAPDGAVQGLVALGLLPAGAALGAGDLAVLRRARELVRELASANTAGRPYDPATIAELGGITAGSRLSVGLHAAGLRPTRLEPAAGQTPLLTVLSAVLASIHDAAGTDAWPRVKACANTDCRWLFYDRSRSRTRRWCAMKACGNIVKARTYRRRHRGTADPRSRASRTAGPP
jgi:predicted RNA-binding Zn ribbon-like protein